MSYQSLAEARSKVTILATAIGASRSYRCRARIGSSSVGYAGRADVRERSPGAVASTEVDIASRMAVSGDRKLEKSTPRLAPGRPQPPTMRFDNRAADREAHAHAVGLRCVEGFKEKRQALRAQPMAGIPHRDEHALWLGAHGADVQFAVAVLNATHRLDGIDDQVQHHLLKLHAIEVDAWQLARQLRVDDDAGLDRFAAG